mmetsp:Transcript_5838/g.19195  ORF Transcript_5838/g.19195 Transcript_5838/m.19195 type:complete len:379 (-) Transcript_5838:210-1346(-)
MRSARERQHSRSRAGEERRRLWQPSQRLPEQGGHQHAARSQVGPRLQPSAFAQPARSTARCQALPGPDGLLSLPQHQLPTCSRSLCRTAARRRSWRSDLDGTRAAIRCARAAGRAPPGAWRRGHCPDAWAARRHVAALRRYSLTSRRSHDHPTARGIHGDADQCRVGRAHSESSRGARCAARGDDVGRRCRPLWPRASASTSASPDGARLEATLAPCEADPAGRRRSWAAAGNAKVRAEPLLGDGGRGKGPARRIPLRRPTRARARGSDTCLVALEPRRPRIHSRLPATAAGRRPARARRPRRCSDERRYRGRRQVLLRPSLGFPLEPRRRDVPQPQQDRDCGSVVLRGHAQTHRRTRDGGAAAAQSPGRANARHLVL